jgi:hypothetical protein
MKKTVHYSILSDMQKYIPNFDPSQYESGYDKTDPSVIEYVKNYYSNHLHVDVTAWIRVNDPDPRLIYAERLGEQICFVRDRLCRVLFPNSQDFLANPPTVISTHFSKSLKLPVYQIDLKKYGVEIVLRNNFYDWKVSVKSDAPLDFDTMGLFDPTCYVTSIYCEGFPEEKVYGSYSADNSKFTVEIRSDYDLYTFMYLLMNYLKK